MRGFSGDSGGGAPPQVVAEWFSGDSGGGAPGCHLPEKSNPDYYVHSSRSGSFVLGFASGISRLGAKT
jgi:hypothetical protein